MRKRNRHVSVWMNEAEYLHLKAEAKKAGLGIDPFIRTLTWRFRFRIITSLRFASHGETRFRMGF